jgi:hypothetical protein
MVEEMSKPILSLIAAGSFFLVTAATTSIGFVRSAGDFRVDGSVVRGNSTVFDGNVIETEAARSVIQLNGVQLTLAPESRAKIYHDRAVLEKGTGTLRDDDRQVFEAASLRISPSAKDSVVQVDLLSANRISVMALSGGAQVRNSSGLLVASVRPGMALAFDVPPQAGGSSAVKLTGMVSVKDGKYYITDGTSNVTAELRGNDLAKFVGKTVEISGSIIPNATPAPGASEVVQVSGSHKAVAAAAAGAAGAGAAVGLTTGATVAIVGGIAVAGTVGGLAAAGTFKSSSSASHN